MWNHRLKHFFANSGGSVIIKVYTTLHIYLRSAPRQLKFMLKINGESLDLAGKSLAEYLAGTDYDPKRIAVERNGEIVPKALYAETLLADGDSIEIVSFVGGG